MAAIKNIIFDLGGVLLDIDYGKTKQAFEKLGFDHFDEMYTQFSADPVFAELETGFLDEQAFYDHVRHAGRPGVTKEEIIDAWNAMLLRFRTSSLDFLEKISASKNIYLLSNTNSIHLQAFSKMFSEQTGNQTLDHFFTKAYYSHQVGLRKPHQDIFDYVLADAGIKAEETLFIDDSYNNIDTAKEMGFQTHLLATGELIEELDYH